MRAQIVLAVGALLLPGSAAAAPLVVMPVEEGSVQGRHPLHALVDRERGTRRFLDAAVGSGALSTLPRTPAIEIVPSPLDCEHAKHDIQLDPMTGSTHATLELRVRARGAPLSAIGLSLDQGLEIGAVTSDGRSVTSSDSTYAPLRLVRLDISPPIASGASAIVRVPYSGTLACGSYPEGGGVSCAKGRDFSYFAHQSIFPYIFDPDHSNDATLDLMTRDIVLRVPSDMDVVATGEKIAESTAGATKISSWTIDRPLSRIIGLYAFAGHLGLRTVPGRAVPTTLVFPIPEQPMDQRLSTWSTPALDFVENLAGTSLPFDRSLSLVRLPTDVGDPGTATFGMTLLSETYARAGDLMHEETWAHENSHLFWGIVVPEKNTLQSRLLSEGLATLTELDYTYAHHFANEDRDLYLARRFVPIGLDLRTFADALPPIETLTNDADFADSQLYTLWAYSKTAAMLDHLRATVGDDVFGLGLRTYVQRCQYVGCAPSDFFDAIESVAHTTLQPFYRRWVSSTSRPEVVIAWLKNPTGAEVELTKADIGSMTLELWIDLEDGRRIKRRVDLAGPVTRIDLPVGTGVQRVAPNPRHDLLVDARSAVAGDLDFDGEADGFDVLRCAGLFGKAYESNATGLWNVNEKFDPRCDLNGDMRIDDTDMNILAEGFGTVRPKP